MKCCGTCDRSFYDKENILRCPLAIISKDLMELGYDFGKCCTKYIPTDDYIILN